MANETFEEALKIVQALPPQDQRRLRQWLDEQEHKAVGQETNGENQPASFREREMRWISEHQTEYAEQWVALDGDRLLSHGTDGRKVYAEAHAQGVKVPFVAFIEDPHKPWVGGW